MRSGRSGSPTSVPKVSHQRPKRGREENELTGPTAITPELLSPFTPEAPCDEIAIGPLTVGRTRSPVALDELRDMPVTTRARKLLAVDVDVAVSECIDRRLPLELGGGDTGGSVVEGCCSLERRCGMSGRSRMTRW